MLADGDILGRAASEPTRFTPARQSLAVLVGPKGADLRLVARKGGGGGGQPVRAVEQSFRARVAPTGGKQPGSLEGASRRGGVSEREPRPARSCARCLLTLCETCGRQWATLGNARAGDLCVRARPRLERFRPVQSFATQVAFWGLTASERDRAARGAIAGQPVVAAACERSVGSGRARGSDVRGCAPMSCRVAEVGGRRRAQRSQTRGNPGVADGGLAGHG